MMFFFVMAADIESSSAEGSRGGEIRTERAMSADAMYKHLKDMFDDFYEEASQGLNMFSEYKQALDELSLFIGSGYQELTNNPEVLEDAMNVVALLEHRRQQDENFRKSPENYTPAQVEELIEKGQFATAATIRQQLGKYNRHIKSQEDNAQYREGFVEGQAAVYSKMEALQREVEALRAAGRGQTPPSLLPAYSDPSTTERRHVHFGETTEEFTHPETLESEVTPSLEEVQKRVGQTQKKEESSAGFPSSTEFSYKTDKRGRPPLMSLPEVSTNPTHIHIRDRYSRRQTKQPVTGAAIFIPTRGQGASAVVAKPERATSSKASTRPHLSESTSSSATGSAEGEPQAARRLRVTEGASTVAQDEAERRRVEEKTRRREQEAALEAELARVLEKIEQEKKDEKALEERKEVVTTT